MKKLLSLIVVAILTAAILTGCSEAPATSEPISASQPDSSSEIAEPVSSTITEDNEAVEAVDVKALALKGATAMGMVDFMNSAEGGELTDNNYTFEIITDTSEVAAKIGKKEVDIAAVPANLASVLYNNTEGGVQVIAINTLGVLYMLENGESITSVENLRGKTIYATGKNAVPEYTLRYILSENGIDPDADVTIEWLSESAEVLSSISATEGAIAMLPQPFVTTALSSAEGINVVLDLTEEWDKVQDDAEFPSMAITGVVVARTEFVQENPQAVDAFLSHYESSVNFVNENLEDAAKLVGQYDIVPEAVALKAIPECNITFIAGTAMYDALSGYLNVLYEQNPASIGETLPDDSFYYGI